ncbi:MAG TPA: hypothetical protein VG322_04070 [Candidatus Acidoferrales bacterium]|jgi:hypothetical protein|nr:hypothetical protein [Candidatus Acidoferrales bacterium]
MKWFHVSTLTIDTREPSRELVKLHLLIRASRYDERPAEVLAEEIVSIMWPDVSGRPDAFCE